MNLTTIFLEMAVLFFLIPAIILAFSANEPRYQKNQTDIILSLKSGKLKVQLYTDKIIRITFAPAETLLSRKSLVIIENPQPVKWEFETNKKTYSVVTDRLKANINIVTGAIQFHDRNRKPLLQEHPKNPRTMTSARVLGEKTFHATQRFILTRDEGVFGLGQHQDGYMNYRGKEVILVQTNTVAVNPFLISTNGYGILWDNYSKTIFKEGKDGMSLWSEVADQIDYYFIAGDTMDEIIAGYRFLTGPASLFGKWAYGYWQSKERYRDARELVGTVEEFRQRHIPIDNIVQDWRYWGENEYWSSMKFDESIFPEPEKMIERLHNELQVHLMNSIWPAVGVKTEIYKELKEKELLYPPKHWSTGYVYDAYSKEARDIYWRYIKEGLISRGVDALWMDATEPELGDQHSHELSEKYLKQLGMTALGSTARYLNPYSLMTTEGVYQGFRRDFPDRRVFILTRSAFTGQQRNATVTWSGDISANWDVFRKQISAGINFCLSGIPYWTHDIGAFFPSGRGGLYPGGCKEPAYQELYVRWFQFGAFTPIFRSHGTGTPREPWQFGEPGDWAYDVLLKYDHLRYRLLPYIYSLAWKITTEGYTLMRGLPMDFPADKNTHVIDNQYMFGSAIMVTPVTIEMYHRATIPEEPIPSRNLPSPAGQLGGLQGEYFDIIKSVTVYLPECEGWYDFWTGEFLKGGQAIEKETPIDIMPLYVKAGSIIPMGPFKQYATEKPENPIELRIYTGAEAEFVLYEDENENYNYERGLQATIPLSWNEKSQMLTIGKRKGYFPGMLQEREFQIVWVKEKHGTGFEPPTEFDFLVKYVGEKIVVRNK